MGTTAYEYTRRSERRPQKIELTLLGKSHGLEFEQPAHTVNVSDHGLRIRTDVPVEPSRPLSPGQIVYVYGVEDFRLGYARVVWVQTEAVEAPTDAGLEFLN